jgi:6-phosphogluconolactonase
MGGLIQPNTQISGTAGNPGIPFFNSPFGGFFETPNGGFGMSLAGQSYFSLENLFWLLGYKPPQPYAFTALAGSPFANGGGLGQSCSMSPDGRHLYVGSTIAAVIVVYAVNTVTGQLMPASTKAFPDGANSITVSPNGLFVTVGGLFRYNVFPRNPQTGQLGTEIAGSPFNNVGAAEPTISASSDGLALYTVGRNTGALSGVLISPLAGTMVTVAGMPLATGLSLQDVVVSPNGLFVYVSDLTSKTIFVYSRVPATGVLTQIGNSAAIAQMNGYLAISPDGLNLYSSAFVVGQSVYAWSINQQTGMLTPIASSNYAGAGAERMAVSPDGLNVYVNDLNAVKLIVYSRNPATGALTPVAGSPFAITASHTSDQFAFSPNSLDIYFTDSTSGVFGYQKALQPTYSLIEARFDPFGFLGGVININGSLQVGGLPVALAGTTMASQYVGSSGGGTVAYTLTPPVPITAYADGQLFLFKANATNTTGAATMAISGLPALPTTKSDVAMPAGAMEIGSYYWGLVEQGGTHFRISPFDAVSAGGDTINGELDFVVAGSGLMISEAANGKQGVAVLVAGTVVIANTSITANSRILLSPQETGLLTGIVRVSARAVGVSFTLLSTVLTDTATIAYEIFEPG